MDRWLSCGSREVTAAFFLASGIGVYGAQHFEHRSPEPSGIAQPGTRLTQAACRAPPLGLTSQSTSRAGLHGRQSSCHLPVRRKPVSRALSTALLPRPGRGCSCSALFLASSCGRSSAGGRRASGNFALLGLSFILFYSHYFLLLYLHYFILFHYFAFSSFYSLFPLLPAPFSLVFPFCL